MNAWSSLISVDFGSPGSVDFSGVESVAAVADPSFAGVNSWNHLDLVGNGPDVSPTFSALSDNNGNATSVGFSITGTVGAFSFEPPALSDALRTDFLFFNSRNLSTSIDWQITGLVPNTEHVFFAYGAAANFIRNMDLILDTDGDGNLSDETAMQIGSAATDFTASNDTFFALVRSDATDRVLGMAIGVGAQY